jgi:hypothetical protein
MAPEIIVNKINCGKTCPKALMPFDFSEKGPPGAEMRIIDVVMAIIPIPTILRLLYQRISNISVGTSVIDMALNKIPNSNPGFRPEISRESIIRKEKNAAIISKKLKSRRFWVERKLVGVLGFFSSVGELVLR